MRSCLQPLKLSASTVDNNLIPKTCFTHRKRILDIIPQLYIEFEIILERIAVSNIVKMILCLSVCLSVNLKNIRTNLSMHNIV